MGCWTPSRSQHPSICRALTATGEGPFFEKAKPWTSPGSINLCTNPNSSQILQNDSLRVIFPDSGVHKRPSLGWEIPNAEAFAPLHLLHLVHILLKAHREEALSLGSLGTPTLLVSATEDQFGRGMEKGKQKHLERKANSFFGGDGGFLGGVWGGLMLFLCCCYVLGVFDSDACLEIWLEFNAWVFVQKPVLGRFLCQNCVNKVGCCVALLVVWFGLAFI